MTVSDRTHLETKSLRETHVRRFLRRVVAASEAAGLLTPAAGTSPSAAPTRATPGGDNPCARRGGTHRTVMRLPAGHLFPGNKR